MVTVRQLEQTKALREEVEIFLRFGVPEESFAPAMQVVDRYREDVHGLLLLREYYRDLPEAREEPVEKMVEMAAYQGVKLFAVITNKYVYLYVVDSEQVLFVGENGREIEQEYLVYFGFPTFEDLHKACMSSKDWEEYKPRDPLGSGKCPACSALEGEFHQVGCPVEVCPWCQGQLNRCNCRFDQLGVEQIDNEEQIARLHRLLNEKGRIRFSLEQAPFYPGLSEGLDPGKSNDSHHFSPRRRKKG